MCVCAKKYTSHGRVVGHHHDSCLTTFCIDSDMVHFLGLMGSTSTSPWGGLTDHHELGTSRQLATAYARGWPLHHMHTCIIEMHNGASPRMQSWVPREVHLHLVLYKHHVPHGPRQNFCLSLLTPSAYSVWTFVTCLKFLPLLYKSYAEDVN